jgi:hypothetical protein
MGSYVWRFGTPMFRLLPQNFWFELIHPSSLFYHILPCMIAALPNLSPAPELVIIVRNPIFIVRYGTAVPGAPVS